MIASLVGPVANVDDPVLKRVRRARLSIHMSTPRVRRWLLVQLVSMPVDEDVEDVAAPHAQPVQPCASRNFQQLIEDYRMAQTPKLFM